MSKNCQLHEQMNKYWLVPLHRLNESLRNKRYILKLQNRTKVADGKNVFLYGEFQKLFSKEKTLVFGISEMVVKVWKPYLFLFLSKSRVILG